MTDDEIKQRLKLRYLPFNIDVGMIDECERYLDMSDDDQRSFVANMSNDEYEFSNALKTARAMYQPPVHPDSVRDGSHTLSKLVRHPERYDT